MIEFDPPGRALHPVAHLIGQWQKRHRPGDQSQVDAVATISLRSGHYPDQQPGSITGYARNAQPRIAANNAGCQKRGLQHEPR